MRSDHSLPREHAALRVSPRAPAGSSPWVRVPLPAGCALGGHVWAPAPSLSPRCHHVPPSPVQGQPPTWQLRNHFLSRAEACSELLCFLYHFLPAPRLPVFSSSFSTPSPSLQPWPLRSENRNGAGSADNHDFLTDRPSRLLGAGAGAAPGFGGHVSPRRGCGRTPRPLEPHVKESPLRTPLPVLTAAGGSHSTLSRTPPSRVGAYWLSSGFEVQTWGQT